MGKATAARSMALGLLSAVVAGVEALEIPAVLVVRAAVLDATAVDAVSLETGSGNDMRKFAILATNRLYPIVRNEA